MKYTWPCRHGIVLVLIAGAVPAAEPKASQPAVFGTSQSEDARMLRREATDKAWHVVKKGEQLNGGNTVLGLSGAVILSQNKAVDLTLLTDLTGRSPFPIIESVVILPAKPAEGVDMDVILDRGRINLTNMPRRDRLRRASRSRAVSGTSPWKRRTAGWPWRSTAAGRAAFPSRSTPVPRTCRPPA